MLFRILGLVGNSGNWGLGPVWTAKKNKVGGITTQVRLRNLTTTSQPPEETTKGGHDTAVGKKERSKRECHQSDQRPRR